MFLEELITEPPLRRLAATLDRSWRPGTETPLVPDLWHWLYFTPEAPQSHLAVDGHPVRGGFLPDSHLPRRMWAGGELTFHQSMRVGDRVLRRSRVHSCESRNGRSGEMLFVGVEHEFTRDGQPLVSESQTIVYREPASAASKSPTPPPGPTDCDIERTLVPDSTLLFRYSGLTFNTHRIHYDQPYATGVEGYPGLVVHAPLTATLLMDLLQRGWPQVTVRRFQFRSISPLFGSQPMTLRARRTSANAIALWASNNYGGLAMEASAEVPFPNHSPR